MTTFTDVRQWGTKRGLEDTDDIQMKYQRFQQEALEIHLALVLKDEDEFQDAIGDVIVTLILLAKAKGYFAETCLDKAFSVIQHRKGITQAGQFVRYGKLSDEDKLICDIQQGSPGSEYFSPDIELNPINFKKC